MLIQRQNFVLHSFEPAFLKGIHGGACVHRRDSVKNTFVTNNKVTLL